MRDSLMDTIFGADGDLARHIPAYWPRTAQREMADCIAQAIEAHVHLVAEAGTGTGKTFAYLIPAILSGKKIIVSTGTKNLQDQLFQKDLPVIRKALGVPFQAALLKGRSNYLCRYRLDNTAESGLFHSRAEAAAVNRIRAWAGRTRSGDIAEVTDVSEGSPVWFDVTSTADNCLGQECPDYADCFLVKARRKAQEADILVINHHLLCADWSLRSGDFGELLPEADVVIIDEAHQLAETASHFLGMSVSARQLNELAKDTVGEQSKDAGDMGDLADAADALAQRVKEVRRAFGEPVRRGSWQEMAHNPDIIASVAALREQLHTLSRLLEIAAERSKGLESCFKRCGELAVRLQNLVDDREGEWIRWFETHKRAFTLTRTPIEIDDAFQQFMQDYQATWIFTSATLTVAGRFDHFMATLGLKKADTHDWESPFDYGRQALFYHPHDMPDPNSPHYSQALTDAALPVLKASQGRAFFLFTSHRTLRETAELLGAQLEYPLLIQGDAPKSVLIERFKALGSAILMGSASFWEGVDVRGPALSCVIIDKLPFAAPGDPVLKARLDALRRQGSNPFSSYQLPAAVIALKQGVGRLIRDVEDRGLFMLCDPRLLKRSYGRVFLASLPPMRRTRSLKAVQRFFVEDSVAEKESR
jgi:ATP-dependent DNA helicase DinG